MVIQEMDDGSIFVSQPVYGIVNVSDSTDVSYPMHASHAYSEGDEERIDSTWFNGVIGVLAVLSYHDQT